MADESKPEGWKIRTWMPVNNPGTTYTNDQVKLRQVLNGDVVPLCDTGDLMKAIANKLKTGSREEVNPCYYVGFQPVNGFYWYDREPLEEYMRRGRNTDPKYGACKAIAAVPITSNERIIFLIHSV